MNTQRPDIDATRTPDGLPRWMPRPSQRDGYYPLPVDAAAGTTLRALRSLTLTSQRELAERTGLAPSTIGRIESGSVEAKWGTVLRCVRRSGFRLALVEPSGRVVSHAWLIVERDRGGRRYPPHLRTWRLRSWTQWWRSGREARWPPLSECVPFSFAMRPQRPKAEDDPPRAAG